MTHYFMDSSALAKLFLLERGTDEMIDLVSALEDSRKFISALAPLEIRSAIRRQQRTRELKSVDIEDVLGIVQTECSRMVEQPLNNAVLSAAAALMDRQKLHTLDALQLASCKIMALSDHVTQVVFVCSDADLLEAAENEGLQTLDPASA